MVFDQDRGQDRGQRPAGLGGGVAGAALLLGPRGRGGQPLAGRATFSGSPDNLSGAVGHDEQPGDEKNENNDEYHNHVHAHQVSVDYAGGAEAGQGDHIVRSGDEGDCYQQYLLEKLQKPPRPDNGGVQLFAAPPQLPVRGHDQARLALGDDLGDNADDRVVA